MSLLYVRHGSTQLNARGAAERSRGWLPVGLAPDGVKDAQEAAQHMPPADQIASFSASDLPRAMQTAQVIGQAIGKEPDPLPALRTWNTGRLGGQKTKDIMPLMQALISNPTVPAPDGEPFNHYLSRLIGVLKPAVRDPGLHVMVGHGWGASVLEGLADPVGGVGQNVARKSLSNKPTIEPGGMMLVRPDWSIERWSPGGPPEAPETKAVGHAIRRQAGSLRSLGSP